QAEDGIRDRNVTGVQTCALPISDRGDVTAMTATDFGSRRADVLRLRERYGITLPEIPLAPARLPLTEAHNQIPVTLLFRDGMLRSEERRVGKECRWRWGREE